MSDESTTARYYSLFLTWQCWARRPPSATYFLIRQGRWPLAHTPNDSTKNNRTPSLDRPAVTEPHHSHLSTISTAADWSVKPRGSTVPRFQASTWHFAQNTNLCEHPGHGLTSSPPAREPRPLCSATAFEVPTRRESSHPTPSSHWKTLSLPAKSTK